MNATEKENLSYKTLLYRTDTMMRHLGHTGPSIIHDELVKNFDDNEEVIVVPSYLEQIKRDSRIVNNLNLPANTYTQLAYRRDMENLEGDLRQLTVHLFIRDTKANPSVLLLRINAETGTYRKGALTMVQGHCNNVRYDIRCDMSTTSMMSLLRMNASREFLEEVTYEHNEENTSKIKQMLNSVPEAIIELPYNMISDHFGIALCYTLDDLESFHFESNEPHKHTVEIIPVADLPLYIFELDSLTLNVLKSEEFTPRHAFIYHINSEFTSKHNLQKKDNTEANAELLRKMSVRGLSEEVDINKPMTSKDWETLYLLLAKAQQTGTPVSLRDLIKDEIPTESIK